MRAVCTVVAHPLGLHVESDETRLGVFFGCLGGLHAFDSVALGT